MERTPSPPRRIHTPPAPGTSYEPFSPRRSSRVAAQRDSHIHSHPHLHHEQSVPRSRRDVTPTASSKRSVVRATNLALSPPSSPVSPQQSRTPRSVRRTHLTLDSDSDHAAPTPARRGLSAMPSSMLPTPAKTPRKRPIGDLASTARVLFPQRPATIDEAMPTPRKVRKTKNMFTLESYHAHMEEEPEKIAIFTDSKERIPTPGAVDDNPFITKKGKGRAKAATQKSRKVDQRTAKMNEAVQRDEGMVYIFRGKKILRRFHDGPSDHDPAAEEELELELSADERAIRRQVGREAHRPLTRSSVKPRLLFEKEIQQRRIANGEEDDDEEAVTDIEVPVATPSRKKGKVAVPQPALDATPPPTVRKLRKEISFDSWSRVKSTSTSSQSSKKRSGDLLERESEDKRVRTQSS